MKDAICFGCDKIAQIDVGLNSARCACGGNMLPLLDLKAFRAARLAHRLGGGYFVHTAILEVSGKIDQSQLIDWQHTRDIYRKDGSKITFAFDHYIREANTDAQTKADLDRVWLGGAFIALGDVLDESDYFDRAPILELMRHLRNGIAHGNRFDIRDPSRLIKYPANNFHTRIQYPAGGSFEITDALHGQSVLFDFLAPGDCVDLFFSVEVYLFSLAVVQQ